MRKFLLPLFLISREQEIAEDANVTVALKMSLLGIGTEGAVRLNNLCKIRLGINYLGCSKTFSMDNTKYTLNNTQNTNQNNTIDVTASLRLLSIPFYVDYHPCGTPFCFTVGMLYNGNEFLVETTPTVTIRYQGKNYGNGTIGTIQGKAYFDHLSGFIGFRYDTAYRNSANLSFNFEIGLLLQSAPKFSVALLNSSLQSSDVDILMTNINNDIQNIKIPQTVLTLIRHLPIIGFEIRYRF